MVFFLVLALNSLNPSDFKNRLGFYFKSDTNIGGEVTEIVSAPEPAKEAPFVSSALGALATDTSANTGIFEDSTFDERAPLMIGEDSLLQNQNPATITLPEPAPVPRPASYCGPSLDGYFIFPTTGYNRGRLHPHCAVDISSGDSCLYENIPVFAAASGVVSATYPTESASRYANSGYGNNILLLHPNGVITRYAHLKNILVIAGQYVNQGSIIAFMGGYPGTPGAGNSTGCHLHFGVSGAAQPFAR